MKGTARPYFYVKAVLGFLVSLLFSCDTDRSVDPTSKDYFVKYYGGNGNQYGVDMIQTDDGNFLLLGNWEIDRLERRIYLVKVDQEGKILWEKKLGTDRENAKDIERTLDGNYIILSENSSAGNSNVKLIRIRPDGSKIDSSFYGYEKNEIPETVTPLLDGGFIVTGATAYDTAFIVNPGPDGSDVSDVFHYRCADNLIFSKTNWSEQYGNGTYDVGIKVIQQAPDLFYVFGASNVYQDEQSTGKINLLYYQIDADGSNGDVKRLGDPNTDTQCSFVMNVPANLGGGLFLVGTESTPAGVANLHVTKLRTPLVFKPADDELFDRSISIGLRKLASVSACAVVTGQQGYLVVANEELGDGTTNIWLTKIDHVTGSVLWSSTFGTVEENDSGASVRELPDGKILMLGTIGLVNNQTKMTLMKLNSRGQLRN